MSRKSVVFWVIATVAVLGILIVLISSKGDREFELVAKDRSVKTTCSFGGTEVRTGWSNKTDPEEALKEAVGIAGSGRLEKPPDLAIIFATSGSDMGGILSKARQVLGDKTKIYGGTSDSRGVMTNERFIKTAARAYADPSADDQHALAIMTVCSKEILFGVGSANCLDHPSVQQASKSAVLKAIASAGK